MSDAALTRLKIKAADATDLSIIAALLQDAVVTVGDIGFWQDGDQRHLALVCSRFCWESPAQQQRAHTALLINNVQQVQYKNIDRAQSGRILNVLSVQTPTAHVVDVVFAENAVLRCTINALEVFLSDLHEPWPTQFTPHHPDQL